jgi:hypothetical protein
MSWGVIYRLPWRDLDAAQVEAAARAVAATLPGALLEVTPRADLTGRVITCYFGLPLPLARSLEPTPADLDRKVASTGPLGVADPPWVQIDFVADDEEWPPGSGSFCRFAFDTADSGNRLCTGAAQEIAQRFGRHFGVRGRASWEADA